MLLGREVMGGRPRMALLAKGSILAKSRECVLDVLGGRVVVQRQPEKPTARSGHDSPPEEPFRQPCWIGVVDGDLRAPPLRVGWPAHPDAEVGEPGGEHV